MISNNDYVFFEACQAIGCAFNRSAHNDPKFMSVYSAQKLEWDKITQGLLLTLFCHLIEAEHGDKDKFKSKLKTESNGNLVDILFIARNAFVHCKWDISKLKYPNQIAEIKNFIGSGYKHPFCEFEMSLVGDKLQLIGLESICRTLFHNI